jgi:hypothetical protein
MRGIPAERLLDVNINSRLFARSLECKAKIEFGEEMKKWEMKKWGRV